MSLSLITSALFGSQQLSGRQMSVNAWTADAQMRGEKVKLFRDYASGDHRSFLTAEMRRMLRIIATGSMNEFNDNYCDVVIQTEADRLEVTQIQAQGLVDTDYRGQEWLDEALEYNRFDGIQMDLHEATLRDGDGFILVGWDNDKQQVKLTLEDAYDGECGMLVMYSEPDKIECAIKIWRITLGSSQGDTVRVNVYYADRIEKYVSNAGGDVMPYTDETGEHIFKWTLPGGEALGVPVIHFPNRKAKYSEGGISEIENAIPLQDALNRTLISMVMTAELTAFQIRYAIGFKPPADTTPGMWVNVYANGGEPSEEQIAWFNSIKIGALVPGQVEPFIAQAKWLKGEISSITRTPAPEFMGGDSASGEALKQREIGLLGKVRRFQVKAGNAWEDVALMMHRVQSAYGSVKPPAIKRFSTKWQKAEIRNDTEVVDNAMKVADQVGDKEFLRLVAPVFDYDEAKIEEIIAEKEEKTAQRLEQQMNALPRFGGMAAGNPNGNNAREPMGNGLPMYDMSRY